MWRPYEEANELLARFELSIEWYGDSERVAHLDCVYRGGQRLSSVEHVQWMQRLWKVRLKAHSVHELQPESLLGVPTVLTANRAPIVLFVPIELSVISA